MGGWVDAGDGRRDTKRKEKPLWRAKWQALLSWFLLFVLSVLQDSFFVFVPVFWAELGGRGGEWKKRWKGWWDGGIFDYLSIHPIPSIDRLIGY